MEKKEETKIPEWAPYAVVAGYIAGLFFLASGKVILGLLLVIAGVISGVYVAVKKWKAAYKPARRPDTAWETIYGEAARFLKERFNIGIGSGKKGDQ